MQNSLFDSMSDENKLKVAPLAARMRPQTLDEYFGQEEAVGEGTWLRNAISSDTLSSIILFGPAGTGKTSLARIIAKTTHAYFEEVSAVTGSVADLRKAIADAQNRLGIQGQRTILFIDEIHRFSKSQQDALLHAVEDRTVVLIGATTENPYFEVNPPLVSRSRVVELGYLSDEAIEGIISRALSSERGLKGEYELEPEALSALVALAGGDARVALSTLESSAQVALQNAPKQKNKKPRITRAILEDVLPQKNIPYDKKGDNHYDVISAFIKSMRGSDPDGAVYWLAYMLNGGEDPKFIARRMFILASEDIGNADPHALLVAEAAFKACEVIGMPECRINLAHAAIYLACAPKSNACYVAINEALQEVKKGKAHRVPSHLRDRHRPGSEAYGDYLYPHNYEGGWVEQQYLPDDLLGTEFYRPKRQGVEEKIYNKKYKKK